MTDLPAPVLVPADEADLTPAWFRAVLADAVPDASFAALERERIGARYGFASRLYRCSWRAGERRAAVVVKLWRSDDVGDGEVRFYRNVRTAGVRVPGCFHAASDPARGVAVLVLEDLSDAAQGDDLAPLGPDRSGALARALAGMHASWTGHPDLDGPLRPANASRWDPDDGWIANRRERFLARFADRLDASARGLLAALERGPAVANERLADAPPTLLHGDLHLDNVRFAAGDEPVLLDWSRPRTGPAALDLATLLFRMIEPAGFDRTFARYRMVYDRRSGRPVPRATWERWLGGALLRSFATATCGVARWEPASPREALLIDAGIARARRAVRFWRDRDPELFERLA